MVTPAHDGRSQRGDRTAEALIVAAREGFARRGYAGASVRDIAAAAGAHPALVRYHFGSKEGLYVRVIDASMAPLVQRLLVAVSDHGTPPERIRRAAQAYFDYLAEDPDFPRLVQRGLLDADPHILRVARIHMKPLVEALLPLVGTGGPRFALQDLVMSMYGAIVAPFLYAPMFEVLFEEDPSSPEALERRRVHIDTLASLTLRAFSEGKPP